MSPDALVAGLGYPLATFVYCVASGFIPVVNAELFLVGIAALAPRETLPAVAALAAAGQMVAKCGMYLGGRGVVRLPKGKRHEDILRWQARVERWRSKDLLVLLSAAVGLPPFFVTSILAGTLRFPFVRFLLAGYLGRLLRFGAIVAVPAFGRWLVGGTG
ncbi:MAG TPA: VTT domain-containing protein [Anaeromyxobacter sp.]|nr:VTT domain-containing protein [Anaeromyxobacter sp.]